MFCSSISLIITAGSKTTFLLWSNYSQNDLCLFPRQTIQYYNNPNICPATNAEEAGVEWCYEDQAGVKIARRDINNPEFICWILTFNMITIEGRTFGRWLDHEDGALLNEILLLCSFSVLSDSLQPHGVQHTRLPCPSSAPRAWAKLSINPSNEYSGLISFKIDWFNLLVQGNLKCLLQYRSSKASILWCSALFMVQLSHPYMTTGKNNSFD